MQEDITFLNICASNIGALKYIRQIQVPTKGEIDINTIIVGNFNIPLMSMDILSKQKIIR